jgi:hypothetical protein
MNMISMGIQLAEFYKIPGINSRPKKEIKKKEEY